MKKISIFPVALIGILFFSPSCSKKNGPPPACKIVSATDDQGGGGNGKAIFTLAYDNDGRISVFSDNYGNGTSMLTYAYSGNTVVVTNTSPGAAPLIDSIVLNSDGLPVSDRQHKGSDSTLTTYTYSGTEIQKVIVKENNNPPTTTSYTYTNGDMTSVSNASGVSVYTYDASKPSVPGDLIQFVGLVGGVPFIRCAHLVTTTSSGNSASNVSYVFDNKGNITSLALSSSTGDVHIDYTYQCN